MCKVSAAMLTAHACIGALASLRNAHRLAPDHCGQRSIAACIQNVQAVLAYYDGPASHKEPQPHDRTGKRSRPIARA